MYWPAGSLLRVTDLTTLCDSGRRAPLASPCFWSVPTAVAVVLELLRLVQ